MVLMDSFNYAWYFCAISHNFAHFAKNNVATKD